MVRPRPARSSQALAVPVIALIIALGGTGYAIRLPANSVANKQLRMRP